MGTMELLRRNRVDTAASITSNQTFLLAKENLQDLSTSVRARMNNKTNVILTIQLSADTPYNIRTVAFCGTNLTPSATVLIEHSTNGSDWTTVETLDFGTPIFGFGQGGFGQGGFGGYPSEEERQPIRGEIHISRFASINSNYWRFTFNDSGNPDSFIEVGRVWIVDPFIPEFDFTALNYGFLDDSTREISDAQALYSDVIPPRRYVEFSINRIREGEVMGPWSWLLYQLGGSKPFPILFAPEAQAGAADWLAINGFFQTLPAFSWAGPSNGDQMFSLGSARFEEVF